MLQQLVSIYAFEQSHSMTYNKAYIGFHFYDFWLTLDQQLKLMWQKKLTIPVISLLLLHISTICYNVSIISLQFTASMGCQVCCNYTHHMFWL